ncbi:MAG: glycosyltransferase [Candidatus Obscuribacterales bacterium]|nr:glycosyltransferase [Candidatus Obscuribacterales bacterium]
MNDKTEAKRVLILSASIGTGHVRAGDAIKEALTAIEPEVRVRHEDALEFANPPFRKLWKKSYSDLVNNAPELLGLLYDHAERVWPKDDHGLAIERWNSGSLIKLATSYQPDVVVCTHPMPADMISWLLCKNRIAAQHAIVLTDFDSNPMWLCQHYSHYFVALDETLEHLCHIGYDRERITVSGIPVDPLFAQKKDKQTMLKKHGLAPDRDTLLLSAGGLGMGPVEPILSSLMQLKSEVQIVAVCGQNQELKARLESLAKKHFAESNTVVKILGFSKEMDELMTAADLIVGKPGGLTLSEAMVKGLPFVIVNPVPGQEERNSDHLLEAGAAIRCNTVGALGFKIDSLLQDRARLQYMKQNALNFAHPDAANIIVHKVRALSELKTKSAVHPINHKCENIFGLPKLTNRN